MIHSARHGVHIHEVSEFQRPEVVSGIGVLMTVMSRPGLTLTPDP